jgi:hypothetical protein
VRVQRQIDPRKRVVTLRVSGELDDSGLLRLADELRKDPEVQPDFSLLIDLTGASGRQVTSGGVRTLVSEPLVLSPTSRRAVVVPSDLGYGMARMYELQREKGGATRVFRDFDEALRWVTGEAH